MSRLSSLILCLLLMTGICWATGNEPVNTLPNPNLSSFRTVGPAFWNEEIPDRIAHFAPLGFVSSGGYHTTIASCVGAGFSLDAVTDQGHRVTADGNSGSVSIDYSTKGCNCSGGGSDVAWVIASAQTGNSVGNYSRYGSTNIFVNCTDTSLTIPADSVPLLKTTITSGAITAVDRLYTNAPGGIIDLEAPPYNVRCTDLGTDNTTAINTAVSSAPLYGAVIQIPRGRCYVASGNPVVPAIVIDKDYVHIRGYGRDVSALVSNGPILGPAQTRSISRFTVSDLELEDIGTGSGDHCLICDSGTTYSVSYGTFRDLYLFNRNTTYGRRGIILTGGQCTGPGYWNTVTRVFAQGTTVQMGSGHNASMSYITMLDPFDAAISLGGASCGDAAGINPSITQVGIALHGEVHHNIIVGRSGVTTFNGGAINVNNANWIDVHHNIVDGSHGPGILADPDASLTGMGYGCVFCSFSDNIVVRSGLGDAVTPRAGIQLDGIYGSTVSRNKVSYATGSGIEIRNGLVAGPFSSIHNIISDNVVLNNGQTPGPGFGIYMSGVSKSIISNNQCSDTQGTATQQQGIYLSGNVTSDTTLLLGNTCLRNTANALAVTGGWTAPIIAIGNEFPTVSGADLGRGSLTISDANTTGTVTFAPPQPNTSYKINLTLVAVSGGPASGSKLIESVTKGASSFTLTLQAAPGAGKSVTYDWMISAR